jgi:hypothetical protein
MTIDQLGTSVYDIPTDQPEADGTMAARRSWMAR